MYADLRSREMAFAAAFATTVGTFSWSIVSRTPSRMLEKKIPSITSTSSSFTSFCTWRIASRIVAHRRRR